MLKAQEAGVLMRFNADVERIEEERSGVRIVLRDRDEVLCERVLVATNGFTPALLPELDVVPARSQVLITAPIPGLRLRGTFQCTRASISSAIAPVACCWVAVGTSTWKASAPCTRTSHHWSKAIWSACCAKWSGQAFTIANRCCGTLAFGSRSKSHLVERIGERVVVAVRMGGMGMAIGLRVAPGRWNRSTGPRNHAPDKDQPNEQDPKGPSQQTPDP